MSTMNLPSPQSSSLKNSWKYLTQEKLPRIDTGTIFKEAYAQLNRSGSSGFLLVDKGDLRGWIKADRLAQAIVKEAKGDAERLRELSAEPIGKVVERLAPTVLVTVTDAPPNATEVMLDDVVEETVFRIAEADGTTGWYLNHETVREAATKPTVFVCQVGHRNPDPDHGTCYSCPFPIVGTITA